MFIGLSTTTYDLQGDLILDADLENSDIVNLSRRVSKQALLDGGVSVNDFGFSEGDRKVVLAFRDLDEETSVNMERIFKLYSKLALSARGQVLLVNQSDFTIDNNGVLRLTVEVVEEA